MTSNVNFDAIPSELKDQRRWVVARSEMVNGRKTKIPYCAHDPKRKASSTDSSTWSDFETARRLVESGQFTWVGFQFDGSGYAGIDFDNCVSDGLLAPWAEDLILPLNSYTETSQSGTGIHVLVKGALPAGARRTGKKGAHPPVPEGSEVEMYDSARYFVFTGHLIGATQTIEARSEELAALHATLFRGTLLQDDPVSPATSVADMSDDELIARIRKSKQADKFDRLMDGDTSLHGDDDSATDLALCTLLAFWTQRDRERIDRIFRTSKLMRPKWDRADYREKTLDKACQIKDVYEPSTLILDPGDPLKSARAFLERFYIDGERTLQHQNGVFYLFDPDTSCYFERPEADIKAALYAFLEKAKWWDGDRLEAFKPTKSKVESVIDALRAVCNISAHTATPPCWLRKTEISHLNPLEFLACSNGLLHIPTRQLYRATPSLFSLNGLSFAYDPFAPAPIEWLKFLQSLWPDDQESIDTLQEIFGLLLTPDTQFQKIFLIVGPKRSGKGTIGRVITLLIGERNVCNPRLSTFGGSFGLQSLIGKSVAIIADARISSRTDTAAVAESLLNISGEDGQTIPRKFLPDWMGRLLVRFVLLSNELPRITDASGALLGRLIVLQMKESFYGREDLGLLKRLKQELPGILKWGLDGRDRLYGRQYFVQPASAQPAIEELDALTSPVGAFFKERCVQQAGAEVSQSALFDAWRDWCQENGRDHPGTKQSFARDLRAAFSWIDDSRHQHEGGRERFWVGLTLKPQGGNDGRMPF